VFVFSHFIFDFVSICFNFFSSNFRFWGFLCFILSIFASHILTSHRFWFSSYFIRYCNLWLITISSACHWRLSDGDCWRNVSERSINFMWQHGKNYFFFTPILRPRWLRIQQNLCICIMYMIENRDCRSEKLARTVVEWENALNARGFSVEGNHKN
jgi:hypothetical protein